MEGATDNKPAWGKKRRRKLWSTFHTQTPVLQILESSFPCNGVGPNEEAAKPESFYGSLDSSGRQRNPRNGRQRRATQHSLGQV